MGVSMVVKPFGVYLALGLVAVSGRFRPGGFQAANLKKRTFETDGAERAEIDRFRTPDGLPVKARVSKDGTRR